MTPYQENRLIVLTARLDQAEANSSLFIKHFWKVLIFGIGLSFYLPFESGSNHYGMHHDAPNLLERTNFEYLQFVLITFLTYAGICVFGHIVFTLQDHYRIKSLTKQLQDIKDQIAEN